MTPLSELVLARALGRNFIQSAQKVADDKKVTAIAGHQAQSVIQHIKCGDLFDSLDVVDMTNQGFFKDAETKNKHIEGFPLVCNIYI